MGSLGLPATAMAVRSAFALLCFALLCGLAASSAAVQSETETELKEGEAAGNQVLVEEALESREARGAGRRRTKKERECDKKKGWEWKKNRCKPKRNSRRTKKNEKITEDQCKKKKGREWSKKKGCINRKQTQKRNKKRTKSNLKSTAVKDCKEALESREARGAGRRRTKKERE